MLCRHCHERKVNRPKGLCFSCYYRDGVRVMYPSTSKFAARGTGLGNRRRPLPIEPTDARPGSALKVAVMMERAARGELLFHPKDSTGDDQDERRTAVA